MIKQKAFAPLPHKHVMGDIDGLDTKFVTLEHYAFGAGTRTERPMCRIVYTGSFNPANATDTFMGAGMSAAKDNASMFNAAGSAGSGGLSAYARIRIPVAGWYFIHWKYFIDGIGSTVCTAQVTMNGVSVVSNAIVSGQGAGSGWAAPVASDVYYCNVNDYLYFGLWHNAGVGKTVYGDWWANKTAATVQWVSH